MNQTTASSARSNRRALIKILFFVIAACVLVAWVREKSARDQAQRRARERMEDALTKAGYRYQPDGSFRPESRDGLWREGTGADFVYRGRTAAGQQVEIYAMEGEKRVYGRIVAAKYIEGFNQPTDIEIEGRWTSNGIVVAVDGEGSAYVVTVTERTR